MHTKSTLRISFDGKTFDVVVEHLGEEELPTLTPAPSATAPHPADPAHAHRPAAPRGGQINSPMAGKIVSLDVKPGADVKVGQAVITLEAMKMNTVVSSPFAGRAVAFAVAPGDVVEEGRLLLSLD